MPAAEPARIRGAVGLVAIAALLGSFAGLVSAASKQSTVVETLADVGRITGVGERLILVVGGVFDSSEEADSAAAGLSFGDMAGFYVDTTDNYRVIGFYEQTSPDALSVACEDLPESGDGCPRGTSVAVLQPVSLRFRELADASGFLAGPDDPQCESIGSPPCTSMRLRGLLVRPSWEFAPGRYLLVSALRTRLGAEEFVELARNRGAAVSAVRVVKLGGPYVGLGQEAHPDGVSGPLLSPLPDPDQYQR